MPVSHSRPLGCGGALVSQKVTENDHMAQLCPCQMDIRRDGAGTQTDKWDTHDPCQDNREGGHPGVPQLTDGQTMVAHSHSGMPLSPKGTEALTRGLQRGGLGGAMLSGRSQTQGANVVRLRLREAPGATGRPSQNWARRPAVGRQGHLLTGAGLSCRSREGLETEPRVAQQRECN